MTARPALPTKPVVPDGNAARRESRRALELEVGQETLGDHGTRLFRKLRRSVPRVDLGTRRSVFVGLKRRHGGRRADRGPSAHHGRRTGHEGHLGSTPRRTAARKPLALRGRGLVFGKELGFLSGGSFSGCRESTRKAASKHGIRGTPAGEIYFAVFTTRAGQGLTATGMPETRSRRQRWGPLVVR